MRRDLLVITLYFLCNTFSIFSTTKKTNTSVISTSHNQPIPKRENIVFDRKLFNCTAIDHVKKPFVTRLLCKPIQSISNANSSNNSLNTGHVSCWGPGSDLLATLMVVIIKWRLNIL